MISVFFSEKPIGTFNDTKQADMSLFSSFFHEMLESGIHLPPSGFESWFLSTTLSGALIEKTIVAADLSIQKISKK